MRDIPGYEGLYAATSCGKIWSHKNKMFLKPTIDKDGYYHLALYKKGKRKNEFVHRLVALTYVKNQNNYSQINHKDENKQNNSINNLEWCNVYYNINYGTRTLRAAITRKNNK